MAQPLDLRKIAISDVSLKGTLSSKTAEGSFLEGTKESNTLHHDEESLIRRIVDGGTLGIRLG